MKIVSVSILAMLAAASTSGMANAEMFNGPSVGAQVGWVQNSLRNPATGLGATAIDESQDPALLGAMIGYDKRFGSFVLGGEAGLSFGTNDQVSSASGTMRTVVDPKRSLDLTARAGYVVSPGTMVYSRAGYTNDRVRTTIAETGATLSASEDRGGWLVGGGIERVLGPRLSGRVEYRYADLSDGHRKYDRHQLLSGIVFRF